MDEVTLAKESYHLILKDFGLEEDMDFEEVDIVFDWLTDYLTRQVSILLDQDFNRLLNTLYRIDISEEKTKELINLSSPETIARNIAIAIIEREKEKVISRERYRKPQ
ncbi:MAG: hypothetical protein RIM99_11745 [Cyclobacteriaceae bacterium]